MADFKLFLSISRKESSSWKNHCWQRVHGAWTALVARFVEKSILKPSLQDRHHGLRARGPDGTVTT